MSEKTTTPDPQADKYKTEPVFDSKGNRISNLVQRNGVYYVTCQIGRKRYLRASPYDSMTQSASWARKFIQDARAGRWEKLDSAKARSGYATMPAVIEAYREAARHQMAIDGKPAPRTVENNILQLTNLIKRKTGCETLSSLGSECLTREMIEQYVTVMVSEGGNDLNAIRRKRITAASSVRQAKSVFTKWARTWYADKGMLFPPTLNEFMTAGKTVKPDKYQIPSIELRDATKAAANILYDDRNELYAAYCLCYDLGMRAGEAMGARWDWIECDAQGNRFMSICRRSDSQAKNRKARRIPVSATLWNELQLFRRDESEWIIPGTSPAARRKLIVRQLAAWMRKIGWDKVKYPKAAHELRKLAASMWYTKAGLQWAATWLGDTPETVYHYYADATELGPKVEMR